MYTSSKRQVMEPPFLSLPGLTYFGHDVSRAASPPLKSHIHENCMEFVFVVGGGESYDVENKRFLLSGGDVFISFANQPHQSGEPFQGVREIYWFQLDITQKEEFLGLSAGRAAAFLEKLTHIDRHTIKAGKEIFALVKKSFYAFLRQKDDLYAASILLHLLSGLLEEPEPKRFGRDKFLLIEDYIDRHLDEAIGLDELCDISGLSLSTIKHSFKEHTGKSPRDYINFKKIMRAKEMLANGMSVTETAMKLGFNTSDYFSTVFRRYTSVTPTVYKGFC